ncbi:MAG TPA: PH domain-containing protein [Pseudonocardiaceae bacterium]
MTPDPEQAGTGTTEPQSDSDWLRLDPRMLAVTPLRQLLGFLPVIAVVLVVGVNQDLGGRVYGLAAAVGAVVILGVLRWVTTRYRITDERITQRSGLLVRKARSVPRDRIRSVDLTAGPVHRFFGLAVVKIGTGQHAEGIESRELTLDAVSAVEADRLRQRLLDRPGTQRRERADGPDGANGTDGGNGTDGADGTGTTGGAVAPVPAGAELGALNWSWLRFAPLTASSLVAVGAVAGAFGQFVGDLGVDPSRIAEVGDVGEQLSTTPLWLGVFLLALVVLAVAALGAVVIFVASWWGFRLVREPGGVLRIRHGLLTSRSVSLEERRLRGAEVAEPLLMRIGRGARLTAVATGLGGHRGHGRGALLPPAPRSDAHRVAGRALAEDPSPTGAALRRHPVAALRRRVVRAVLPVLAAAAALELVSAKLVPQVPAWAGWAVLGLLPVTVLLAVDAYRNLGHSLTERYLVTRHGTGERRTVALKRSGVIGWTVSQSLFQRWARLVTLTATTAAGSGAYHVFDVRTAEALALAEQAMPGLLEPFLHPHGTDTAAAQPTIAG